MSRSEVKVQKVYKSAIKITRNINVFTVTFDPLLLGVVVVLDLTVVVVFGLTVVVVFGLTVVVVFGLTVVVVFGLTVVVV